MDRTKIISTVIRIGTVILTTVLSFVVLPPVTTPDQYSALSWKNILVFFAGVIWVIFYRPIKEPKSAKRQSAMLIVILLLLIGTYEFFYNKYSILCDEQVRVIITDAPMKTDAAVKYKYWLTHSQNPILDLMQSNGCSSLNIWDQPSLMFPYYGLLTLYLLIILVIIFLLVIISELMLLNPSKEP